MMNHKQRVGARMHTWVTPFAIRFLAGLAILLALPAAAQQLIVGSYRNSQVMRYDGATGAFDQVLVPAGSGGLDTTQGMACPGDGYLYVASEDSNQVLRYNLETGAFMDAFVPANSGGLSVAAGLSFGPDGHLYVASYGNDSVMRYNGDTGAFMDVFTSLGGLSPEGITFGPDGHLYVASYGSGGVIRFNGDTGTYMGFFVPSGSGGLSRPLGLIFGPDGHLYVASEGGHDILRYDGGTGAFLGVFAAGGGLETPFGLVFGPDGNLYVGSYGTDQVLRYHGQTGAFIDVFASGGGLDGSGYLLFCGEQIIINAGLNDSWYNPAKSGQGFFIVVFPGIKYMFVAMFTFEAGGGLGPGGDATFGAGEHRWFTAFGPFTGNRSVLEIEISSGGVFNSPAHPVSQAPGGTLVMEFWNCRSGMATYNLPAIGLSGIIPIVRIVDDNTALCRELSKLAE